MAMALCPLKLQFLTTIFLEGMLSVLASRSLPALMAMLSSLLLKTISSIRTFSHDSGSIPSLFRGISYEAFNLNNDGIFPLLVPPFHLFQ